jgi:mannose-1-phosphate guanylyltransferase
MLEWLRRHGVEDVVMSMGYLATAVRNVLGDGSAYGVRIRYVEEPDPRGTAGALKYAESLLDERFFMLNGDVLTDLDLSAQLAQHERTGARGTLGLVPVDDPSPTAWCARARRRRARVRREAPADQIDTNLISAGAYILERSVLDLIEPDRNVSIEREIWPALVGEGLYAYGHEQAYWMDIGTPERYLQGTFDIIEGLVQTGVIERLGDTYTAIGADVKAHGRVVPPAVVGRGSVIAVARTSARWSCSATASRSASTRSSSGPWSCRAPRSARAACCATASSGPGRASARAPRSTAAPCSAKG